ncbi:uncharacterized protein SOCE836_027040 [Sorangium cellulosum]|uniref:Uncharacterized protein n=1 Tax=Sorangium cellulosum TaxID=56 RepID=A0A4P2QKY5_SORCE|nr:uncharacterized protein SOCE836_027040 [Sorangium cellulosum]
MRERQDSTASSAPQRPARSSVVAAELGCSRPPGAEPAALASAWLKAAYSAQSSFCAAAARAGSSWWISIMNRMSLAPPAHHLRLIVYRVGLRSCDMITPCRQNLVCVRNRDPGTRKGACIPPYFVFPLRIDGCPIAG